MANQTHPRPVWRERLNSPPKSGLDIARVLLFPAALAIVSFLLGQCSEQRKEVMAQENSTLESRSKIALATAADFSNYVTYWSRLITISSAEEALAQHRQNLAREVLDSKVSHRHLKQAALAAATSDLAVVVERKRLYVVKRDEAKDKLLADLEHAKLFFADPEVLAAIRSFEEFDRGHSSKRMHELPPLETWRGFGHSIFSTMRDEIRKGQEARRRFWRS